MSQSPLDYRSPDDDQSDKGDAAPQAGPHFALGTALYTALFVGVLAIILILVIPRFENTFKDFGTRLPLVTTIVLDFSLWFRSAYYAWPVLIAVPVVAGLMVPRSPGTRRWARLLLTLCFAGVVILLALALLLPLVALIDNVSGGGAGAGSKR